MATLLQQDIERYTSYQEIAHDGLCRCHPNDETRFKEIIKSHEAIIAAMKNLDIALRNYNHCEG